MDESKIKTIQAVCFLPAAMLYAFKVAGVELTTEEQINVIKWSIAITTAIYSTSTAGDIVKIISDSIRRTGNCKAMAEFTDYKILELVAAAQNGGAINGNITDRN